MNNYSMSPDSGVIQDFQLFFAGFHAIMPKDGVKMIHWSDCEDARS